MTAKLIIGALIGFLFGFALTEVDATRLWLMQNFDVTDVKRQTLIATSLVGAAIGLFFGVIDR